jgi:hypothetical protein
MEPVKISLADAAKSRGCTIDYLLALAEAGHITIFARLGPFSATLENRRGEPVRLVDTSGTPLTMSGPQTRGGTIYTTLLDVEAGLLRSGKQVTVRVVREEGAENGVRFAFLSDEEYLLHLTEPQTIGIEQICINDESVAPGPVEESSTTEPTAAVLKPIQRSAAQDAAILSEIRALGLNPQAVQTARPGKRAARATVRDSMMKRDPNGFGSIFSSNKVFETAWQRLRDTGQICDS